MLSDPSALLTWAEARPEATGPLFVPDRVATPKTLLDYQQEALTEFKAWWLTPEPEAALLLTVGMGKTVTACSCLGWHLEEDQRGRVLWLTHRTDLVDQSAKEIEDYTGFRPGIEQADRRSGFYERVVVASVDSLEGKRLQRFGQLFRPTLIICDEAHHALARSWLLIKQAFPQARILNLTATPYRRDVQKRLNLGRVLIERNTTDGIRMGRLVPPKPVGKLEVDLGKVKKQLGDYATGSLAQLLSQPDILEASAALLARHLPGRKGILFGADVAHCRLLSEAIRQRGFQVAEIYAATPRSEREEAFRALAAGEINLIANYGILTEGFNLPAIDLVAIFRPTKNSALYLQMLGRGLRAYREGGKSECLVIDVIDAPKHKGSREGFQLPNEHDVFTFQAISGQSASAARVFLSWFTLHTAAQAIASKQLTLTAAPRFPNAASFLEIFRGVKSSLWPQRMQEAAAALEALFANTAIDDKEAWSLLWKAVGCQQPEAVARALHSRGWGYYPRNEFKAARLKRSGEEEGAAEEEPRETYSLATLISEEASLRNFCLDLLGEPELDKQAQHFYEAHPFGLRQIVWFRPSFSPGFKVLFLETNDKTLWLRRSEGRMMAYRKTNDGWASQPNLRLKVGDIPWWHRTQTWATEPMTPKQLPKVCTSLGLTERELASQSISRLAASAILSAFWRKKDFAEIQTLWQAQRRAA